VNAGSGSSVDVAMLARFPRFTLPVLASALAAAILLTPRAAEARFGIPNVNPVVGDESWRARFGTEPTGAPGDARTYVHLRWALDNVRARSRDLSQVQHARREALLDVLGAYADAGRFPKHALDVHIDGRVPRFADDEGTLCAVGALIAAAHGREAALAFGRHHEYEMISEMQDPLLDAFTAESGLDRDDLATIQPTYAPRRYPFDRHPIQLSLSSWGGLATSSSPSDVFGLWGIDARYALSRNVAVGVDGIGLQTARVDSQREWSLRTSPTVEVAMDGSGTFVDPSYGDGYDRHWVFQPHIDFSADFTWGSLGVGTAASGAAGLRTWFSSVFALDLAMGTFVALNDRFLLVAPLDQFGVAPFLRLSLQAHVGSPKQASWVHVGRN
jgi:hypothetical protein